MNLSQAMSRRGNVVICKCAGGCDRTHGMLLDGEIDDVDRLEVYLAAVAHEQWIIWNKLLICPACWVSGFNGGIEAVEEGDPPTTLLKMMHAEELMRDRTKIKKDAVAGRRLRPSIQA